MSRQSLNGWPLSVLRHEADQRAPVATLLGKILDLVLTLLAAAIVAFTGVFAADTLTDIELLEEIWQVVISIDDRIATMNAELAELVDIAEEATGSPD